MNGIFHEGYFTSEIDKWPGRCVSVRIQEPVVSLETDYHLLEMFRGEGFGLVLAVDGVIRSAESDEYIFHEMFAHTSAFDHECPEQVLVVGDPAGGVVRELLKHSCVEQIDWCEQDELLLEECSRRVGWTSGVMKNPRVEIVSAKNGFEILLAKKKYDLILICWPEKGFVWTKLIRKVAGALNPGGVFGYRSGALVPHSEIAMKMWQYAVGVFPEMDAASVSVPSFPGGACGFILCSDHTVSRPVRRPIGSFVRHLKAYSVRTHAAAFVHSPLWEHFLRDSEDVL